MTRVQLEKLIILQEDVLDALRKENVACEKKLESLKVR